MSFILGGGFGGKETRSTSVAVPVAIAANKLNCSVRCMLDRDEDMILSGTRHPFLGRYKVRDLTLQFPKLFWDFYP